MKTLNIILAIFLLTAVGGVTYVALTVPKAELVANAKYAMDVAEAKVEALEAQRQLNIKLNNRKDIVAQYAREYREEHYPVPAGAAAPQEREGWKAKLYAKLSDLDNYINQ